jgi:diaminopimelate epimerase
MRIWKGHAYGNDFLMVRAEEVAARGTEPAKLAKQVCSRHTGLGADGLILFRDEDDGGTRFDLLNPDGSYAELSGNGEVVIHTDAGSKTLTPLAHDELDRRTTFRAAMGKPANLRELTLDVAGERIRVAAMTMGNPQCILLDQPLTTERLHKFGPALQTHPEFPAGVNVEIIKVEQPNEVRILIWERGVGPTESSGTGSCASAVAAAAFAGAARVSDVIAPGGSQRVEWTSDNDVFLTGWAQLLFDGQWLP